MNFFTEANTRRKHEEEKKISKVTFQELKRISRKLNAFVTTQTASNDLFDNNDLAFI